MPAQLGLVSTAWAEAVDLVEPAATAVPGGQPEPEETVAQPETAEPAETVVAETSTRHQVDSVAREAQVDLAALADPRAIAMATAEPLATAERLVTVAMATPEFPVPL